jgi:serine/threonine protein kinase
MEALAAGDPARIGPFRLVARLGRGGMGRVYLGRAEATGRAVAVKTIHGELLVDPEFRTRFRHEVAAARRVRDEYIAEVVDADPDGITPWLATAYAPGISLEDAVRRFGALPPESVRVLGFCVARAVAAIHAVGLVHRDLKPANVLLTASGPKVIDFGIARGVTDDALTRTGMVSGSPPYMAPEQLTDGEFGPGSDVFSIAAILHYAATAAGPYGRGGAQEQYARALAAGPLLDPALPPDLAAVIGHCFSSKAIGRPSATQLARQLELHPNERPAAGWLPSAVLQEILIQATDALNTESASGLTQGFSIPPGPPSYGSQPSVAAAPPPLLPPPPLSAPPPQPPPRGSFPSQPSGRQPAQSPSGPSLSPPPFAPPVSLSPPSPGTPARPQPQYQMPPQNQSRPSMPSMPSYPQGYRPAAPRVPPIPVTPRPYPVAVGPYATPYPQQVRRDNGMATAALVVSLVGIIVPCMVLLGLVFGLIGLNRSRQTGSGRGQATAAIIVSAVLIVTWTTVLVILANLHTGTGDGTSAPIFRSTRAVASAPYQMR